MSLINDALRRAKQAQQPAPPPLPAPLRPVEPAQPARRGLGLVLPAGLAAVGLLLLFLIWRLAPQARARTNNAPQTLALAGQALDQSPSPTASTLTATAPTSAEQPTAPATANPDTNPGKLDLDTPSPTPVVVPPPAAPEPAPLRLQGIVFNPRRPSALISGQTVFLGDRVGEFQVTAISSESATLVNGSQTNVLRLP